MASPNATFTEMVTTTLRNRKKKLADNVSKHNALLSRLTSRGKTRRLSGGRSIVSELEYAENSVYQRYSGFDILNPQPSDVFTAAEYSWRNVTVPVQSSGDELRQNAGREQMINLAQARINNAIRTMKNNLSTDFYSDGTAANQINGLQAIIPDTAGGTLGGIDGDTFAFWKSTTQSAAAPLQGGGAITPGKTTMHSLMMPLYLELTRQNDRTDLIVMTNDYYSFFWEGLTDNQRYAQTDEAVAGFSALKFVNADVVFDGGTAHGSMGSTSRAYFINTDFLMWEVHREADMDPMPEIRSSNQDAVIVHIITSGNLTCSNRKVQGVITA
jgi:hypothetical protein